MSTAVHGKASLAEMLLSDGAPSGKDGKDERDKTNTVDFGATLMSLIDQKAVGKDLVAADVADSPTAPGNSKHSADATTQFDSSADEADSRFSKPATAPGNGKHSADARTQFDSSAAEADGRFSKPAAAQKKVESESPTLAPSVEVDSHSAGVRNRSFAALLNDHTVTNEPSDVGAQASNLRGNDNKASAGKDLATPAPSDKSTGDPVEKSADTSTVAQAAVTATTDLRVPDADIALDFRKQPFASKVTDDAAATPSTQITAPKNFAKVVKPEPIDVQADLTTTATPRATESARSQTGSPGDGTSSALSTSNSMDPNNQKDPQATLTKLAPADATTSNAQQASLKQVEAAVQMAPTSSALAPPPIPKKPRVSRRMPQASRMIQLMAPVRSPSREPPRSLRLGKPPTSLPQPKRRAP